MNLPDYYAILCVTRDADSDEIRRAYRRQARAWHPDVHGGASAAEAQMKQLNEARDVLLDAERRHRYDAYLAAATAAMWHSRGSSFSMERCG